MKYSRDGDTVTLTMSREEHNHLIFMLGMGAGAAHRILGDANEFRVWLRLVNNINNGNPDFTPYETTESEKTDQ